MKRTISNRQKKWKVESRKLKVVSTKTISEDKKKLKAGTYGTVTACLLGSSKLWITQNLGATVQGGSATDNTDAAAGWYWKFNREQGYAKGPAPTWTSNTNSALS
ncbi:MAG: hypothetical protein H7320_01395 [Ferruginibacter sp.]|nr:hypothetical protein [Ferruginibacter sp.]